MQQGKAIKALANVLEYTAIRHAAGCQQAKSDQIRFLIKRVMICAPAELRVITTQLWSTAINSHLPA
jgi:hypothetical protein